MVKPKNHLQRYDFNQIVLPMANKTNENANWLKVNSSIEKSRFKPIQMPIPKGISSLTKGYLWRLNMKNAVGVEINRKIN